MRPVTSNPQTGPGQTKKSPISSKVCTVTSRRRQESVSTFSACFVLIETTQTSVLLKKLRCHSPASKCERVLSLPMTLMALLLCPQQQLVFLQGFRNHRRRPCAMAAVRTVSTAACLSCTVLSTYPFPHLHSKHMRKVPTIAPLTVGENESQPD